MSERSGRAQLVQRASDIDVVWVYGYGWPVYRGGPMFWADTEGLQKIVDGLKAQEARMGGDFSFSQLLLDDLRRLFAVIHRGDTYSSPQNFQRPKA